MKIITWNCNMAFRKKANLILAHKPDILVVQECECIEKLKFDTNTQKSSNILWFGNNQHKGMAIFAYGGLKLKVLDDHNPALQMIVPILVTGGEFNFTVFAVWAFNPNDPDGRYIEQVGKQSIITIGYCPQKIQYLPVILTATRYGTGSTG